MKQSVLNNKYPFSTDINECLSEIPYCNINALCSNVPGSLVCRCKRGFKGDGKTCTGKHLILTDWIVDNYTDVKDIKDIDMFYQTDVNECTKSDIDCGDGSECVNSQGSYFCQCKKGFTGQNGKCIGMFNSIQILLFWLSVFYL